MDAFNEYLNSLANKNKLVFAEYAPINWINTYKAEKASEKRKKLTSGLENNWLFKNTKLFHRQISPGCRICGEGNWSCLFITGRCNAKCFYCPASQLHDETPSTQNLQFETAESFAEYIRHFGFKGVSFSGGEPMLYFDRTLEYLREVRKSCSPEIYIWMYTNGILAEAGKFRKLADAGLNEVRFDIGATGFRLDKIQYAKGIIPNITIEIPAVPEEKNKIIQLLPAMIDAGVTNLNLHQLRLTKHNAPKLLKRKYTYLHAEQPVVAESELAALEIIRHAHDHDINIGINYCSFSFKNRFQQAGFRKRVAATLAPGEQLTEKGFIREESGSLISYKTIRLTDNPENGFYEGLLQLQHKKYYYRKEPAMKPVQVDDELKTGIEAIRNDPGAPIPEDSVLFKIWQMEKIESGLREY